MDKDSKSTKSVSTEFGDAASGAAAAALMIKFGIKPVKYGLVAAGPAFLGYSLFTAGEHTLEGRPLAAAADILPVIPEGIEMGIAARLAYQTALKQGLWQGARAGGAELAAGSIAGGVIPGVILFLGVDLAQSRLHDLGYDVDNGIIGSAQNHTLNINNAGRYLFPGDTLPIMRDSILAPGLERTMRQTGRFQWEMTVEAPLSPDDPGYLDNKPGFVITTSYNQNSIGTLYQDQLKYFSSFHGNYMRADKNGQPVPDEDLNAIAKNMYDHPDQAYNFFRDYMLGQTVNRAYAIAEQAHTKINGRPIDKTDAIPSEIMQQASQETLEYIKKSYVYGRQQFFDKALAYLDPRYTTDPRVNPGIARTAAMDVLASYEQAGRKFHWDNADDQLIMRSQLDKALRENNGIKPAPAPPQPVKKHQSQAVSSTSSIAPLKTRLSEEDRHELNRDVIGKAIPKDGHFAIPADLKKFQSDLVDGGYLSVTYLTGQMNSQTVRAIDMAIRNELSPSTINQRMGEILTSNAHTLYKNLTENPADPKSFDPRVLSFQTNAYLLGHYNGRIDGINGPKTTAAMQPFADSTNLVANPVSAMAVSIAAPSNKVETAPILMQTGP